MSRVLIIESQINQYRVPFYGGLFAALRDEGIQLKVAYSDPRPAEGSKKDTCELPGQYGKKVNGYWLCGKRLLYQPLLTESLRSDLVIVAQENKFLLNHALLPLSRMRLRRVAFWGHGDNHQLGQIPLSEWYRRKTLNSVSWWFAYTKGVEKHLQEQGVPASKITAVQNSVDTREIREDVLNFKPRDREMLRARLGISQKAPVGIFCGTLGKLKSVPFLIESCRIIRAKIPYFHLLIVGGGPEEGAIHRVVEGVEWIHLVGPQFGKLKAEYIAISDVFLLPSAVGLAILDAFAAGLPLITAKSTTHGPEIEYLEDGVNGLMTEPRKQAYAEAICSLFEHRDHLLRMQVAAAAASENYSIEKMVENFKTGIGACLDLNSACIIRRTHGPSTNMRAPLK